MSKNIITFYDSHKPALEDGHYTINLSQTLVVKDGAAPVTENVAPQTLDFYVSGPRFDLDPSLIYSVYPPVGGKGDYMADLPSMALARSTLPWERSPNNPEVVSNSASWLFLFLVDETETAKVIENNSVSLNNGSGSPSAIATLLSVAQADLVRLPAKINYLEVDPSLISIFPTSLSELQYLSYARVGGADATDLAEEAMLLCNRLPQKGNNSTVYLVSLENNYINSNFKGITDATSGNFVFPYLYKWQFYASDDQLYSVTAQNIQPVVAAYPTMPNLAPLYNELFTSATDFESALAGAPYSITTQAIIDAIKNATLLPGSNFQDLLSNLAGGFAPITLSATAADITSTGTVKLSYNQLQKTTDGTIAAVYNNAWYRSPLAAAPIDLSAINANFPLINNAAPTSSQPLFIMDNVNKITDATYAAAYQLGSLMALNDVGFSTEFYKWKSEAATASKLEALASTSGYKNISHLPIGDSPQAQPMPQNVLDKFIAWKNLQNIPFRYLLPNPDLLPNESIRFFQIDNNWINSFICGAFSIGHTVAADFSQYLNPLLDGSSVTRSGFLINSLVVSGWPDYEVDIFPALNVQNKQTIDTNIQLYLFDNMFNKLSFHLHPAKSHSGFLYEDGEYTKENDAIKIAADSATIAANNVVSFSSLYGLLSAASVADLASKMIEGTPTVVFTLTQSVGVVAQVTSSVRNFITKVFKV